MEVETKAITEVAKTAGKAIDIASKAGSFFATVLGTVPEDIVGIAGGDWLRQQRINNWVKLEARTKEIAKKYNVDESRSSISPKFFIEWSESASLETHETIRDLWASLMSATIDPKYNLEEEPFLIDTLKRLDANSVQAFIKIYNMSYHAKGDFDPYEAIYTAVEVTENETVGSVLDSGGFNMESLPKVSLLEIKGHFRTLQKLAVLGLIDGVDTQHTLLSSHGITAPNKKNLSTLKATWLGQQLFQLVRYIK